MSYLAVLTVLGALDVALQYFCGGSALRHGVWTVLVLSPAVRRTLNGYDNSIRFTDRILGALVEKLKALNRPALFFYVSDHGESPRSGGWRNLQDRDCWEVPMFVWFSDRYLADYPQVVDSLRRAANKPLQMDKLLYRLVELVGLTGTYPSARSFLSD